MSYRQFIHFTSDAGGVEKILRFCQSVSQIGAAYAFTVDSAVAWMHLRRQFALGRRYLRFFKFITCFHKAYDNLILPLTTVHFLEMLRWTFMGCYLGLESLTILDAMGVYPTPLAEVLMLEANKFWFYSLICSIILHLHTLQTYHIAKSTKTVVFSVNGQTQPLKASQAERDDSVRITRTGLISDSADLLIPGHVTGWIKTSMGVVGIASVVSTVLSGKEIWDSHRESARESRSLQKDSGSSPLIVITPGDDGEKMARDRNTSRTPTRSPHNSRRRRVSYE